MHSFFNWGSRIGGMGPRFQILSNTAAQLNVRREEFFETRLGLDGSRGHWGIIAPKYPDYRPNDQKLNCNWFEPPHPMWAPCGVYIGWTVITGSMFEPRKGARASLGRTAIALSSWVMFTNRREICRLRQVDDVPTPNQDTWRSIFKYRSRNSIKFFEEGKQGIVPAWKSLPVSSLPADCTSSLPP